MPHYQNGQPAKLFDTVVGLSDSQGRPVTGVLIAITSTSDACNGLVSHPDVRIVSNADGLPETKIPILTERYVTLKDIMPTKPGDRLALEPQLAATT